MPPRKGDKPLIYCGVGLDVHLTARIDRLRAATGKSRSAVIGALIERAIGFMEAEHVNEIMRFEALASRAGQEWEDYAQAYAKAFSAFTAPPTVDKLERLEQARWDWDHYVTEELDARRAEREHKRGVKRPTGQEKG